MSLRHPWCLRVEPEKHQGENYAIPICVRRKAAQGLWYQIQDLGRGIQLPCLWNETIPSITCHFQTPPFHQGISELRKRGSPSSHSRSHTMPIPSLPNPKCTQSWEPCTGSEPNQTFRDSRVLPASASLPSHPWFSSLYISFVSSLLSFQ